MKNSKTIRPWNGVLLLGLTILALHSFMPSPRAQYCVCCNEAIITVYDGVVFTWYDACALVPTNIWCGGFTNPPGRIKLTGAGLSIPVTGPWTVVCYASLYTCSDGGGVRIHPHTNSQQ